MTQSTLKLSSVRVDLYIDADVAERFSFTSFDDASRSVNDLCSKLCVSLDSLESFVAVAYEDGSIVSYSMYSVQSLKMLLYSLSITHKLIKSLNKKGIFKNGKKKS